jgi:hypothetical protein
MLEYILLEIKNELGEPLLLGCDSWASWHEAKEAQAVSPEAAGEGKDQNPSKQAIPQLDTLNT